MTEEAEGLGEVARAGRDFPGLGKERERQTGPLRAVGQLLGFAQQWCLETQRDSSMGTHGDRTLSTEGPGFLKPANAPCNVETETRQLSSDPECLESEDAGSEHSGLKIKESSLLQALCKPSPHPRLQCSPMREKELR